MFQKKEIDTLVLTWTKYLLIICLMMIITFSFATLFLFIGLKHRNMFWLMLICVLLSAVLPVLFVKLKINLIASKARIRFDEEGIEIKTAGVLNDSFNYSVLRSFSVSKYDTDHASTVKFILKNGFKKRYIFFKQDENDENTLNNMLSYFSSYNRGKMPNEKIQISPGFLLTKTGKLFLTTTAVIIAVAVIIQVMYKPTATPVSLLAVLGGYIQAKAIQMADKRMLEEFKDSNDILVD